MNKKAITAAVGAAAIAMLALFAVTDGAGSATTRATADSGQESKFPTPTPPSPAEVSGAVTTTMMPAVP
ncbi:hypothetical protein BOH72_24470 [Mycobacterium sp. WY10]|nr:hypothetical protein BOH72_24470 [Mycobacterium sp. WY10]